MTQQTYDANDVLMGGGGAPAWKFDEPGTTRTGTIASTPIARQEREYDRDNPGGGALKFFPSGDPIMGILIEVATDERTSTDDDGKRTFYVEGRYIKEAVRNAVRAAGCSKLEIGGRLQVTFTHREDPMDKRSRKFWNVTYTPAANVALMTPETAHTEQGPVNTRAGEIAGQQPQQAVQPVAQQTQTPAPAAAPAGNQPTPEAVAALRAAGVDPATVYPGYTG